MLRQSRRDVRLVCVEGMARRWREEVELKVKDDVEDEDDENQDEEEEEEELKK